MSKLDDLYETVAKLQVRVAALEPKPSDAIARCEEELLGCQCIYFTGDDHMEHMTDLHGTTVKWYRWRFKN